MNTSASSMNTIASQVAFALIRMSASNTRCWRTPSTRPQVTTDSTPEPCTASAIP
ncbi:hypothetical protein BamMEX5DRAFT_7052 [Burkholderia ambifaria MEX-5]|uniref:Uncharacterized protein n=1 Tax=Burkholderia ambifaria MEX-5 TaxID=396597 RepID=B1TGY6_9BURK|nr:hypothetical protein BamMEX5DRAFT_7052 [Burkholderia ambifaria MEX-5]